MDNITSATSGSASRLTFAQKAIATGMSVVLAFGLSPLGQVPAYAVTGDQPAQQEAPLQAQAAFATMEWSLSDDGSAPFNSPALTYAGGPQTITVALYDGDGDLIPTSVTTGSGQSATTTTNYTITALKYTVKDESGKDVTTDITDTLPAANQRAVGTKGYKIQVNAAGKYTFTVHGGDDSSYATRDKDFDVEVGQLDISDLSFALPANTTLTYKGDPQDFALECTTDDGGPDKDKDYTSLAQDEDFSIDMKNVTEAGDHTVQVKGIGSCTGTATATVNVKQAELLTASNLSNEYTKINATTNASGGIAADTAGAAEYGYAAGATGTSGAYTATTGSGISVPYNKKSDPVELTYQPGTAKVTLKAGTDYSVAYYQTTTSSSTETPDFTQEIPAANIGGYTKYWAVIKVRDYSPNFLTKTMGAGTDQTITAYLEVGQNSTLESFVDHVVLAEGVYKAGNSAAASVTDGATFYDKDGNDVSDLVDTHFKILTNRVNATNVDEAGGTYAAGDKGYDILSTNTYNSARLNADSTGNYPVGAGQYYTYVTGTGTGTGSDTADDWYTAGSGVIAYYTVNPAATAEGTAVGELEVTVDDLTFKDGTYLDPSVTVGMFTSKGASAKKIDDVEKSGASEWTGALGQKCANWSVAVYDSAGKKVDKPAAAGDYTAEITFSGNLAGTQKVTKPFKVGTGDIASIASAIKVKDASGKLVDPSAVYTGATHEIDPDDVYFVKKGSTTETLSKDDLAGAEFELSYGTDTASPDAATGKPLVVGAYTVTATFTGSYTGTVSGSYVVNRLNMTATGNANAEVQYLQDGTADVYDTAYSTPKPAAGSTVEPKVRVVVKDGKQTTDKASVVEPAVYTATFGDNTKAGTASTFLKVNSGYTTYATASGAGTAASTFTLTEGSFDDISASMKLSKTSADYTGSAIDKLTVTMNSSVGELPYVAKGGPALDGVVPVSATVTVKDAPLYAATSGETAAANLYYGVDDTAAAADLFSGKTPVGSTAALSNVSVKTAEETTNATPATYYSGTADLTYAMTLYQSGSSFYKDQSLTQPLTLREVNINLGGGKFSVVDFSAYAKGTATKAAVTNATVYTKAQNSDSSTALTDIYYSHNGTTAGTALNGTSGLTVVKLTKQDVAVADGFYTYKAELAYTGLSKTPYKLGSAYYSAPGTAIVAKTDIDTNLTDGSATFTDFAADALGGDYSLRVLDSKGAEVKTVTFSTNASAPFTTVTVNGLKDAGTYTIVAGAGSTGAYGGRVAAEFTINGLEISDTDAFSYTWTYEDARGRTVKVPLGEEWAVDYDPELAKTVAGILLGTPGTDDDVAGALVVKSATGTALVPGTDYEVAYEDNHKAGAAKVTFTGKGNYVGELPVEFTIDPLEIYGQSTKHPTEYYKIDFDDSIYDKATKTYRMSYTGDELKPAFTISHYVGDEKSSTFDDEFATEWFNNTDVYYGRTGVDNWATVQITATGNYEGTLTESFYIDPVTLTADNATYAVADVAYTGNVAHPKATVTWNGKTLEQDKDFAVDVAGATEVGSYTATIKQVDGGNFLMPASVTRDFKVTGLNLSNATVKLANTSVAYTGKDIRPVVTSVTVDGNEVSSSLYEISYPAAKNVGDYDVTVKAKGSGVTGQAKASFKVTKAANTLKVANAKRTVKASKLKKAAQKVTGLKVTTKAPGKVTYKVTKVVKGKKSVAKKNFKLAKSTANKLTVKKGLAKGTYKVTMTAKGQATANYNASEKALKKVVTVVVK